MTFMERGTTRTYDAFIGCFDDAGMSIPFFFFMIFFARTPTANFCAVFKCPRRYLDVFGEISIV